jgi:hypothetical protein
MLEKTEKLLNIIEEINSNINKVALAPCLEKEIFVKLKKIEFIK